MNRSLAETSVCNGAIAVAKRSEDDVMASPRRRLVLGSALLVCGMCFANALFSMAADETPVDSPKAGGDASPPATASDPPKSNTTKAKGRNKSKEEIGRHRP